mgnify:CR=1 FL=1
MTFGDEHACWTSQSLHRHFDVRAIELGKWANGVALTDEQKEQTMQAVIAWQAKHLDQKEHYTIGADGKLIERPKSVLRRQFADDSNDIIRVDHNDL